MLQLHFIYFSPLCLHNSLLSCDYLKKISIKINVATNEGNSRNETCHWTNDEIWGTVKSWLWVQLDLMALQLSRVERLNGIQWSRVQIPLRPAFYSYSKESFSGEYHRYHSFRYTHVVTSRKFQLKQTWRLMKAIAGMKLDTTRTNHETRVAVQSRLWVRVELMTW